MSSEGAHPFLLLLAAGLLPPLAPTRTRSGRGAAHGRFSSGLLLGAIGLLGWIASWGEGMRAPTPHVKQAPRKPNQGQPVEPARMSSSRLRLEHAVHYGGPPDRRGRQRPAPCRQARHRNVQQGQSRRGRSLELECSHQSDLRSLRWIRRQRDMLYLRHGGPPGRAGKCPSPRAPSWLTGPCRSCPKRFGMPGTGTGRLIDTAVQAARLRVARTRSDKVRRSRLPPLRPLHDQLMC
jgi:hypothetical protein